MDILSDILKTVHVKGTLYFRTSFSPPWGVKVPQYGNVSRFHLVTRGTCYATVEGCDEKLRLEKGDLILVTNGAEHNLFCESSEPPFLQVDEVVRQSGFTGEGALVWGGEKSGDTTALVCGHFSFDSERGKHLLDALPPYIHIPNTETMNYGWLESAMKFIAFEAYEREFGSDAIINRMAEVIFIQTVRTFAKSRDDSNGLFAALRDPQIAQVLQAVHQNPGENWTVDSLARVGGMSRTVLSERMKEVIGISPIAYLTQWRMELAHEALIYKADGIPEISEAVGYQSLSAFTRTFKKHYGRNPGEVRRMRQAA
jgi:AraC-like DNA-binding protein